MGMTEITIIELPPERLDLLQPLWERLKEHHLARAPYPWEDMRGKSWEDRKRELVRPNKQLKILAVQSGAGLAGYCIATITDQAWGEIDSLYVAAELRGRAVGRQLMEAALGWLDAAGISAVTISVACGNEAALPFYEKFGFRPRSYSLQRVSR
ncbi:acetyltransferase (GNAT) family protein [Hydrogenispora ethanolica]|uniref:Acetyltransferase (GNAT) family protein n=2 Tax=Hydrogenispora ethanolica TaxID=1082276 RepID=A0A4R1S5H9_HYDET|nr:acetyltransferase (GNAT) family protein [Hydrogenispora ethanolica]